MNKQDIITFFDKMAPDWDADMIKEDWKIDAILEQAGVKEGSSVLDVACGTGVLIPDYLKRGARKVVAVDISPEMIRIAKDKFHGYDKVTFHCMDAAELEPDELFDCVIIYNAFPHFCNPQRMIRHLAEVIKPGGTLTIAHGMSRAQIDAHHSGTAKHISNGLISEDEMEQLLSPCFRVEKKLSNEDMYLVSGRKDNTGGHDCIGTGAYNFYGWETADVVALNEAYQPIRTPRTLYDALCAIWSAETCAPRLKEQWTPENKTLGQCSITAFLAQDIFGGEVRGILRPGGNYHCYNVVGDCVFDLTSEQFSEEILDYTNNPLQTREEHFAKEEKRLRYEKLRSQLQNHITSLADSIGKQ